MIHHGQFDQAAALTDLMRAYGAQEFDLTPLDPVDLGVWSVDLYRDDEQDRVASATITPAGVVREASRA